MPTRKRRARESENAAGTTVSGPSHPPARARAAPVKHAAELQAAAEAMPFNPAKSSEYAPADPVRPPTGPHSHLRTPTTGAGTVSESSESAKTGAATLKPQALQGALTSKRVNSSDQALTTNQGVPISSNQDSLKAGLRGPSLLEDFILREKITHFDHERIPERVVHARGAAAHGIFELSEDLSDLTSAGVLTDTSRQTPVFVRFSTVAGSRGSTDLARDVRGFAVKFYTAEGVWDLVGNNMPVFFIQGENDNVTPTSLVADYISTIVAPAKKLDVVPDAGHFVIWTHPVEFLDRLGQDLRTPAMKGGSTH